MKTVLLTKVLLITGLVLGQKPLGLEKYEVVNSYDESPLTSIYMSDLDTYQYGFSSTEVTTEKKIKQVVDELQRILQLNGRTLESYDALIPDYNEFNSFNAKDILNELIASFHVGFRYILGEYSIYMYSYQDPDLNYLVGFSVSKTSEY